MPAPQTIAPYYPITVAANLRFTDANGISVTQMYPMGATQAADNPTTGYISLIGAKVSDLITTYQQVVALLAAYNTRITTLESEVTAIQTSGVTFSINVNGGCFSGNTSVPIATAVTSLIASECSYITPLGTPTALTNAIAAEGASTLNALPAYSQVSAMSGLANWDSTPTTIAASLANLWRAYLDMRIGVTQALSQSNITCADVHINYKGVYNMSARTISVYFSGSSIPANFSASGNSSGSIVLTDTASNTYTYTFNIYTAISAGFITFSIASSALLQNTQYAIVLSYALTSTTPSLGCNGGIPGTIVNNTSTCPIITSTALSATQIQYTFTPTIIDNVTYTVDLLNSSGSTSGTTVLHTNTHNNPVGPTTAMFQNLTTATLYFLRTSVTVGTTTIICPLISQTTS